MMHRTVAEVMTRDVATASPEASLKTVAWSLAYNNVSALPVVDTHHHPIGIVSEADLLRRQAGLPEAEGRDQLRGTAAVNHRTMDARTAGDLMSTPVLTARPAWSIVETARFLNERGVKRLPVIDDTGMLVGIVSRSDLLRPMLRRDDAIHEEIVDEVLGRTLRMTPGGVTVTVQEGVVTLSGRAEERSTIPIIELLCLSVDGVVSVDQSLEYAVDDLPPDLDPARDADNP
ncbi:MULTISPECIES: CBS domain-containing protein [unclassified Streptomyces]|nr:MULTISPECIES: CBS domain-containing protein [unclassified Streptomyces]WSP59882.1 CBS domain-containing protein [Streptomyces sp. NBC_01241]WSU25777.1 CBS domain-containing protein [Streptomyces sp. NBC_01108]MCX4799106.1 CBS domain-containing protein [Streptomyces sp. NBC_01242]WSJ40303.1 CBS domain-containing protein [Streptomyces sp. NBC_01321]WSP66607.1 CBS domain-containing protein [Streptomyces sp. NBC_01240]